jgi:hypothetical protein
MPSRATSMRIGLRTVNVATAPGHPSLLSSVAMIGLVKASLATVGFAPTVRWVQRRTKPVGPVSRPDRGRDRRYIETIQYAVAKAGALYPGRALCLEQSITLYYYLRHAGVAADLRIGVQRHPFTAHAWVEVAGQPVNDFPEHLHRFASLPGVLP